MLPVIGRFRIGKRLGGGAIGSVYLSEDPAIGRNVAIKVITLAAYSEGFAQRVLQEVRTLGALSHPNIVTLYDVGQVDEFVYIAMEYIEGDSLEQRRR